MLSAFGTPTSQQIAHSHVRFSRQTSAPRTSARTAVNASALISDSSASVQPDSLETPAAQVGIHFWCWSPPTRCIYMLRAPRNDLGPYARSTNSLPIANGTISPYLLTLVYRYVSAIVPLTSLLVLHAYGPCTLKHTVQAPESSQYDCFRKHAACIG